MFSLIFFGGGGRKAARILVWRFEIIFGFKGNERRMLSSGRLFSGSPKT